MNFLETVRRRGLVKDLWLALNFHRLIGNGVYICEPRTDFTKEWFDGLNNVLDRKLDNLKSYPTQNPGDFFNKIFKNGLVNDYPLRLTEIFGKIFHPFCLKYSKKLLKNLPNPDFTLKYL